MNTTRKVRLISTLYILIIIALIKVTLYDKYNKLRSIQEDNEIRILNKKNESEILMSIEKKYLEKLFETQINEKLFFDSINHISNVSNLTINEIFPAELAKLDPSFNVHLYKLSFEGSYKNIIKGLMQIESSSSIGRINSIVLTTKKKSTFNNKPIILHLEVAKIESPKN